MENTIENLDTNKSNTGTNARLRKLMHKIIDLCIDAKDFGHDCFFEYSPHVNNFEICFCKRGWEKGKEKYLKNSICLDTTNAESELKDIISSLEKLIDESF